MDGSCSVTSVLSTVAVTGSYNTFEGVAIVVIVTPLAEVGSAMVIVSVPYNALEGTVAVVLATVVGGGCVWVHRPMPTVIVGETVGVSTAPVPVEVPIEACTVGSSVAAGGTTAMSSSSETVLVGTGSRC